MAIYSSRSYEKNILMIIWIHEDLVIARERIQEAHQVVSRRCVHQNIYIG